jgi:NADPH:quinone reductase-like Zn-dependent oxidoreductase
MMSAQHLASSFDAIATIVTGELVFSRGIKHHTSYKLTVMESHLSRPLFDLTGRTALVTGSSRGIGLALARGLAEHGASVVINSRRQADVDTAVAQLVAQELAARGAAFDVADEASVRQAFEGFDREGIAIDILINNAGIQHRRCSSSSWPTGSA